MSLFKGSVQCVQVFDILYLAEQAVVFFAHWAVESVDSVFINTPARTVCCSTVITALTSRLCNRQTPLQPALIIVYCHQLSEKDSRVKKC